MSSMSEVPTSDPAFQRTIVDLIDMAESKHLTDEQLQARLSECGWEVSKKKIHIACHELVAKRRIIQDGGRRYRVRR